MLKDALPVSITTLMPQVQIGFAPWICQVLLSILANTNIIVLWGGSLIKWF